MFTFVTGQKFGILCFVCPWSKSNPSNSPSSIKTEGNPDNQREKKAFHKITFFVSVINTQREGEMHSFGKLSV